MRLELVNDGNEITLAITDMGPIKIVVPKAFLKEAVRRATRAQMAGDAELTVEGFFDDIGKGLAFFKHQILDNPFVRSVVSAIPYGSAVLTAADLTESAVNIATKALNAMPHKVKVVVSMAAQGHPGAREKLNQMRSAAAQGHPGARADAAVVDVYAQGVLALRNLQRLRSQLGPGSVPLVQTSPDDSADAAEAA